MALQLTVPRAFQSTWGILWHRMRRSELPGLRGRHLSARSVRRWGIVPRIARLFVIFSIATACAATINESSPNSSSRRSTCPDGSRRISTRPTTVPEMDPDTGERVCPPGYSLTYIHGRSSEGHLEPSPPRCISDQEKERCE